MAWRSTRTTAGSSVLGCMGLTKTRRRRLSTIEAYARAVAYSAYINKKGGIGIQTSYRNKEATAHAFLHLEGLGHLIVICDEAARVARLAFDPAPPGAGGGGAAAAGGGGPPPGFAPLPQKDGKVDAIPGKLNRSAWPWSCELA